MYVRHQGKSRVEKRFFLSHFLIYCHSLFIHFAYEKETFLCDIGEKLCSFDEEIFMWKEEHRSITFLLLSCWCFMEEKIFTWKNHEKKVVFGGKKVVSSLSDFNKIFT